MKSQPRRTKRRPRRTPPSGRAHHPAGPTCWGPAFRLAGLPSTVLAVDAEPPRLHQQAHRPGQRLCRRSVDHHLDGDDRPTSPRGPDPARTSCQRRRPPPYPGPPRPPKRLTPNTRIIILDIVTGTRSATRGHLLILSTALNALGYFSRAGIPSRAQTSAGPGMTATVLSTTHSARNGM